MANPNVVNVSTITGVTTFIADISATTVTTVVSNTAASNQVYKINSVIASNKTASSANISLKIFNAPVPSSAGTGSSVSIGTTISVPSGSTLVILGKDSPIYVTESNSLGANAGTASAIDVVASYEVIS